MEKEPSAQKAENNGQEGQVDDSDKKKELGLGENEASFELLIQPQMDFEEGAVKTNEKGERLPATQEQIQEMDQRIEKLSQLFSNTKNVRWTLDGAMNISLYKGDYIGYHKDNDVSVEEDDLPQLEEQLYQNGYGLFLSERKRGTDDERKRVMRRVGHKHFDSPEGHMLIAAIDKKGKIPEDQELNYIDMHLIKRNEKGEPVSDVGAVMPEEWIKPRQAEHRGNKINLSHPGRIIYYKLHMQDNPANDNYGRSYDNTDIQRLIETGTVSQQDVDELEKVYIENEQQANIGRAKKIFDSVAEKIRPSMGGEEIFEILMQVPEIAEKAGDPNNENFKVFSDRIRYFAGQVAQSQDRSGQAMTNKAMELFLSNNAKKKQIKEIRQKVQDVQRAKELKQVREQLKNQTNN